MFTTFIKEFLFLHIDPCMFFFYLLWTTIKYVVDQLTSVLALPAIIVCLRFIFGCLYLLFLIFYLLQDGLSMCNESPSLFIKLCNIFDLCFLSSICYGLSMRNESPYLIHQAMQLSIVDFMEVSFFRYPLPSKKLVDCLSLSAILE